MSGFWGLEAVLAAGAAAFALAGAAAGLLESSAKSSTGAKAPTTEPETLKTARQPLFARTALVTVLAATPPTCCDVCHSPTAVARISAGKRSATKSTSRGCTHAEKTPTRPQSRLIILASEAKPKAAVSAPHAR